MNNRTQKENSVSSEDIKNADYQGWRELYLKEDYWAIWFAAILTLLVTSGIIAKVPKIGKWNENPLDAFPGELLIPLGIMFIGLVVLTGIGSGS